MEREPIELELACQRAITENDEAELHRLPATNGFLPDPARVDPTELMAYCVDGELLVHEGGPRRAADLRACSQGAARDGRPALSSLPHDAPPGHQARAPARPPPRGARARRARPSARERQLAPTGPIVRPSTARERLIAALVVPVDFRDRGPLDVRRDPDHRRPADGYMRRSAPRSVSRRGEVHRSRNVRRSARRSPSGRHELHQTWIWDRRPAGQERGHIRIVGHINVEAGTGRRRDRIARTGGASPRPPSERYPVIHWSGSSPGPTRAQGVPLAGARSRALPRPS
jgi:hypothetical protein